MLQAQLQTEQLFLSYCTSYHINPESKYYYHHSLAIEKVLKAVFGLNDAEISALNEKALQEANRAKAD